VVYIHLLHRSNQSALELPALGGKVTAANVLHGERVPFQQDTTSLKLTLPNVSADQFDVIVKLELESPLPDVVNLNSVEPRK
jgi:hypothetical protein